MNDTVQLIFGVSFRYQATDGSWYTVVANTPISVPADKVLEFSKLPFYLGQAQSSSLFQRKVK